MVLNVALIASLPRFLSIFAYSTFAKISLVFWEIWKDLNKAHADSDDLLDNMVDDNDIGSTQV